MTLPNSCATEWCRPLIMLLLPAGKSPVEYLTDPSQNGCDSLQGKRRWGTKAHRLNSAAKIGSSKLLALCSSDTSELPHAPMIAAKNSCKKAPKPQNSNPN